MVSQTTIRSRQDFHRTSHLCLQLLRTNCTHLTPHPCPLSVHLLALRMHARLITWPTVPKGKDCVRVCLHSGNAKEDIDQLVHVSLNGRKRCYGEV
ncbi:hypothetical protein B0H34DRAFT_160975 [Crassisporium funariophilum]|nr:hypothetical protein B0H34DRAFT_160975 [Crassisporium funariophilum]